MPHNCSWLYSHKLVYRSQSQHFFNAFIICLLLLYRNNCTIRLLPNDFSSQVLLSDALSFPSLCLWANSHDSHETNNFTGYIQSMPKKRTTACLGSQELATMSSAMGWPTQMGWRTYPINTLPTNPCQVTRWLPWHALPVSAALNTCPAPI